MTPTATPSVLFEERLCANGSSLGIATLNAPDNLNSLSLTMVRQLDEHLRAWAVDPAIALVILRGQGDRAFCAGGDLHCLYRSMSGDEDHDLSTPSPNIYASEFFASEYRLDYRIHSYPKPVLCWGHGLVMGGGLGLMAGASHRIVTETSQLAMPEIRIGLFPDVGASWILHHLPGRSGLFLALTCSRLNAADALYAGLADYAIDSHYSDALLTALTQQSWSQDRLDNDIRLHDILGQWPLMLSPGPLQRWRALIDSCCHQPTLEATITALTARQESDPWLKNAKSTLATGCPSSMRLAWELFHRASRLSLAEVFQLEYTVAMHCVAHGDLREGIRALLIDKDSQPHWRPSTLTQANQDWAESFFISCPSQGSHPLADLGIDDPQRRNLP